MSENDMTYATWLSRILLTSCIPRFGRRDDKIVARKHLQTGIHPELRF